MDKRNNYNNNPNQYKNNNYQSKQSKQRIPQNFDEGYSSGRSNQQMNYNNNYNNKRQPKDFPNQDNVPMPNNFRNTEAPNYKNQNNMNKEDVSRMTEFNKGKERPLWSYREIKYDEFKQPRNTENITTTLLPKKNNNIEKQEKQEIPRKSNLEQLQENDKKYFNNVKYQKVKVTKKVKNDNMPTMPKRGPQDDLEQKYSIQNYENNNQNEYIDNQNIYNKDNNNDYNIMDDEQNNNYNSNELNPQFNNSLGNNNNLNQNDVNVNDDDYEYIMNNNNNFENKIDKNIGNQYIDNELDKENFQLDIDTLEEAKSDKNKHSDEENEEEEYVPQLKYNNVNDIDNNLEKNNNVNIHTFQNNNLQNNNLPRPTFIDTTTQKINDIIGQIKTFPEASIEKWNLVADYSP